MYVHSIHSELVNRSADVLRFASSQQLLSEQLIDDMFTAVSRQDEMTKQGFFKLFSEVGTTFTRTQAGWVLKNIQRIELVNLTIEHIEVAYDIVRTTKEEDSEEEEKSSSFDKAST